MFESFRHYQNLKKNHPPNGGFIFAKLIYNPALSGNPKHKIKFILRTYAKPMITVFNGGQFMSQFKNVMEIFKLLDKSNCKKCNEKTCMAFAAAVYQAKRQIEECPHLDKTVVELNSGKSEPGPSTVQDSEKAVANLQKKIKEVDLSVSATKLGGVYADGRLTLKILGKDFSVDSIGQFFTDIHVHAWVAIPVLNYVLYGEGRSASGKWVPFRELNGGKTWYRLFGQLCEKPIKKVADTYTDLFDDIVHLFGGSQVERVYDSDISVILYTLPKVPILVCYWRPEDDLESDLHLFFDDTAEYNLGIESLYTLGTGLALMFEKLAHRHG
jgi:Domain of unknown function (DUF3786)/Putative Fe-S cluster